MRAARTAEGVEGVDRFEWSVALELAAAQRGAAIDRICANVIPPLRMHAGRVDARLNLEGRGLSLAPSVPHSAPEPKAGLMRQEFAPDRSRRTMDSVTAERFVNTYHNASPPPSPDSLPCKRSRSVRRTRCEG
jgi:hypothetical protein